MIIRAKVPLPAPESGKPAVRPILPLRSGILFPQTVLTLHISRPDNINLIKSCQASKEPFVASFTLAGSENGKNTPVHQVGVLARVVDMRPEKSAPLAVTIEGIQRAQISEITETSPFMRGTVTGLSEQLVKTEQIKSVVERILESARRIIEIDPTYSPEQIRTLSQYTGKPSLFADRVAALFHFPLPTKQELLETTNVKDRLDALLKHLEGALEQSSVLLTIRERVQENIEEDRKRDYLRYQLAEIRRQLGENVSEEPDITRLRNTLVEVESMSQEARARAAIELDRIAQLSTASAEYGVTKNYLEWLLSLPWGRYSPEDYDISDVEKILSVEYYGPTSLKEQILQRISVRKLLGGTQEGPTLCMVGAPGTGKAALARAIAKAMKKEFVRISVGGVSDIAELKGSPRTFLGAMPGKIMRVLRDSGTSDPVVLIEDIDYFNVDNNSTVNMALLDAIDTRRNSRFLDNYLGVPFDLSKVLFICSVRSLEEIPEAFIPRFELLELPGYIEKEKITVARRYIIPKLLKQHGIGKSEVKFTLNVLSKIIRNYTQEAGLLGFSQQIERICRKVALQKTQGERRSWNVTEKTLESYLGSPLFIPEKAEAKPEIGTAAGLAWTGAGGELMFIEGLKMKGEGQIFTTGSLGEVMRESIQAAHSYVRSKSDMLAIDFADFNQFDIHIHFPSGAIPKDGPSAGVTVCLVIASVMSERPIRNDIAMTGEVTLRGRVLPVAGIKEKVSAAFRAGIYHVALPKENQKDIKHLPKDILRKIRFSFIERVDELFALCLMDFTPSPYTLEKIFTEEIEKAKRRRRLQKSRMAKR